MPWICHKPSAFQVQVIGNRDGTDDVRPCLLDFSYPYSSVLGLDQKKLLQENSVSRSQHCVLAQVKAEEDLRVVGCGICSFAAIWVEFAQNEQIVCPRDAWHCIHWTYI